LGILPGDIPKRPLLVQVVCQIREKAGKWVAHKNIVEKSGSLTNVRDNQGNIRENIYA